MKLDAEPEKPGRGRNQDSLFAQLNNAALKALDQWIPALNLYRWRRKRGPSNYEAVATWRESTEGRPKEIRKLNLQISSKGIRDYGVGKTYSPLDLVMAARGHDLSAAYDWLAERLGFDAGPDIDFDKLKGGAESPSSDPGSGDDKSAEMLPPLTIGEWKTRGDVEDPDFLMAELLSTTSRMLLVAETGLGKTQLSMALAIHIAAGRDFLHWKAHRPARVLYIDGEMSKRTLRKRILDLARRFTGPEPETLFFLSTEDVPTFAPLNTIKGQKWLDGFIENLGGVDMIIFDSIMCLTLGEQKDPEVWGNVIPWARRLTARNIGQVWIHHTGHDTSRSYGDKTREWQLDVVGILTKDESAEAFVSFQLEFKKARERNGDNAADFAKSKIQLVGDDWTSSPAPAGQRNESKEKPMSQKVLDKLRELFGIEDFRVANSKAPGGYGMRTSRWYAAADEAGLMAGNKNPEGRFRQLRKELRDAGFIDEDADEGISWIILSTT